MLYKAYDSAALFIKFVDKQVLQNMTDRHRPTNATDGQKGSKGSYISIKVSVFLLELPKLLSEKPAPCCLIA